MKKSTLYFQIFHWHSMILLFEKSVVDKFQIEGLTMLVVVIFGVEVFVIMARSVLLEERARGFQGGQLIPLETKISLHWRSYWYYKFILSIWTEIQIPLVIKGCRKAKRDRDIWPLFSQPVVARKQTYIGLHQERNR